MTLTRFLLGVPLVVAVLLPLGLGARRARRRALANWAGADALLVDLVSIPVALFIATTLRYGTLQVEIGSSELLVCAATVLVSAVVFGGVSHHIKKVMDRMAAVGDPRYQVSGGELVKGMSGQGMSYYMVGTGDKLGETERSAFLFLHEENRNIMNTRGKAFLLHSSPDQAMIDNIAQEIAHE